MSGDRQRREWFEFFAAALTQCRAVWSHLRSALSIEHASGQMLLPERAQRTWYHIEMGRWQTAQRKSKVVRHVGASQPQRKLTKPYKTGAHIDRAFAHSCRGVMRRSLMNATTSGLLGFAGRFCGNTWTAPGRSFAVSGVQALYWLLRTVRGELLLRSGGAIQSRDQAAPTRCWTGRAERRRALALP